MHIQVFCHLWSLVHRSVSVSSINSILGKPLWKMTFCLASNNSESVNYSIWQRICSGEHGIYHTQTWLWQFKQRQKAESLRTTQIRALIQNNSSLSGKYTDWTYWFECKSQLLDHYNLACAGFCVLCPISVLHVSICKMERRHSSQIFVRLKRKLTWNIKLEKVLCIR